MITAVDTCILIDVFQGTGQFAMSSAETLSRVRREGPLIICELVYAELAAFAEHQETLDQLLGELEIQVVELGQAAAFMAGMMFASYRRAGGERQAIVADFIIAAHAQHHAQRLLTRERGFARAWFQNLLVVAPEGHPPLASHGPTAL